MKSLVTTQVTVHSRKSTIARDSRDAAFSARALEVHPLARLLPDMAPGQYADFKADIAAHGLREPIKVLGGRIVDGRHRDRACRELGTQPKYEALLADTDVLAVIKSANIERRHLNESQRAMYAARLETYRWGDNQHNAEEMPGGISRAEAAEQAGGVGERTVARARVVLDRGTRELIRAVDVGLLPVSVAEECVDLPVVKQRKVAATKDPRAAAADALRETKEAAREERLRAEAEVRNRRTKGIRRLYHVVVADPPWPEPGTVAIADPGYRPYPTMSVADIEAFLHGVLTNKTEPNCHFFLWTTQTHLRDALAIAGRLGDVFRYGCLWVWRKEGGIQPLGYPQYNCEFIVYMRRGAPKFTTTKALSACFEAHRPRTKEGAVAHSAKPEEFYAMLRRATHGPRLDLFNRRKIEGFDGWGLESPGMYIESPQSSSR